MPRIQGTQRTVETRTTRLTPASTAGYGASGRAFQILGNQVAKAGNDISGAFDAFEAAQEKRDGAHDRMTILETSIAADRALDDHNRNYTGSGKGFRDEADKISDGVWQQSYEKLSPKGQEKAREFQLRKKHSVINKASRRQDAHSQAYVTQRLPKFYGSVLDGSVTTDAMKEHGLQPAHAAISIGKKYIDDAGLPPNVKTKLYGDLIKATAGDVAQKIAPEQYKKDAAAYDATSKAGKSIIGYSRGNLDKFKVANRSDGKKVDVAELKPALRNGLAQLQQRIGKQLTINSGYRDPKHNAKVGGAKGSRHMHRDAVDLQWPKNATIQEKQQIIAHAKALNFKGFGIGSGILHLDMGRGRFWGYKHGKPTGTIPSWAVAALSGKVKAVNNNSGGGVQGQIAEAAKKANIDPEYMIRLASAESGFKPGVKAKTSSATGLFQITGDTAKRLGTSHGKKSVEQEIADGIAITKANQKTMTNYLGRIPRNDELHLAHVFGAGRANDILSAKNETPIDSVLPSEVINANKNGIFKTVKNVGQLKAWAKAKQSTKVDVASYTQGDVTTGNVFLDELFSEKNRKIVEGRWKTQQEQQFISGVVSGEIRITGNDTEAMKLMNKVFNQRFGPETDFLRDKQASELVLSLSKNKTVLPKRWFQKMEGYLSSAEPKDRELAFQLMDKVEANNPENFNAGVGIQNLSKKLDQFRMMSEYYGPKGAVKQMMMAEERLSKMNVGELKAEKNQFIKDLNSEETLLESFDDNIDFWPGGILSGTDQDPTLGVSKAQQAQIKAEFRYLAVSEFEKTGNQELAKASALHMIKKRYGVSEITGHRSVMKYPPESFVDREDVAFIKEQFQKDSQEVVAKWSTILSKQGIKVIGEPILISDEHTRMGYEGWLAGKKVPENISLMNGLSMIEETSALPEWRFALKVEIDGETGYRLVDDYFSIEGFAQRSHERLEHDLLTNKVKGELIKEGKYRPNDPANFLRRMFNYEPREVVNKREELLNGK